MKIMSTTIAMKLAIRRPGDSPDRDAEFQCDLNVSAEGVGGGLNDAEMRQRFSETIREPFEVSAVSGCITVSTPRKVGTIVWDSTLPVPRQGWVRAIATLGEQMAR